MRLVVLLFLLGACFPDNARHRTIAKITEGGFVVAGITILAVSNTQVDCEMNVRPGSSVADCKRDAGFLGGLGLSLLLVGMVGFIATISTEPDVPDPAPTPPPAPLAVPAGS
jgi:hypothetical protein